MSTSNLPPVVLINGTWTYPGAWDEMQAALEARGHVVHAPALRYHDLPVMEGARKVATVSLQDYADDFVELIEGLDQPPIIIGWSLGGLIAQLVAQRVEHKALMLLSPAPAAGMFSLYPTMLKMFYHHFMQWGFWKRPVYPVWDDFRSIVCNKQTEETAIEMFDMLKADSGKAYTEMVFWFLDSKKASKVTPERIKTPVLVIAGTDDLIVRTPIGRATAARFAQGKFVEFWGMDHVLARGDGLARSMEVFDAWVEEKGIVDKQTADK